MVLIDELVSMALLGTRGSAVRLPTLPDDLADVLPNDGSDAESQLLDAAAAATLYSRAGNNPRRGIELPAPAAADRWPECSPRAADILAQAFEDRLQPLLVEWLELSAAVQLRPPHRLLPKLLEAVAASRALQAAVSAVIDERGRWLMQFNPRWQFASRSNQTPDDAWQIGNRQQRAEALRTVRVADAAKAREWIAATWQDESAEERADWVDCLRVGLSDDDEEFLESCLDDRSSRVREAAADLLARLPNSRLVKRMTDRVAKLVSFESGTAGNLLQLKRATKAKLEIKLPEAFDKSLQRDGMTEKPNESLGPRQWWLLQMLGCVPLDYWTQTFAAAPAELIAAAPAEHAVVLVRGWLLALSRLPVVDWIEPLISAVGAEIHLESTVLNAVPRSKRAGVLAMILGGSGRKAIELRPFLEAWRPLDETVSQTLLDGFDSQTILGYDAHFYLHPKTLISLESQLSNWTETAVHRRQIDQALSAIALRGELHKEFAR